MLDTLAFGVSNIEGGGRETGFGGYGWGNTEGDEE